MHTYNNQPNNPVAVTVDVLVFTVTDDALMVALIRRGIDPYKGAWALPGGFVLPNESLDDAARREVFEEAGISDVFLEQLYTFGEPRRDPRCRVVTVSYFALVSADRIRLEASSDAAEASWFAVNNLPPLAFDHAHILATGVARIKAKLEYSNVAYALLPERFRLAELKRVYETILGRAMDKRNFHKWIMASGLLEPTDELVTGAPGRPAMLYRFRDRRIENLK